MLGCLQGVTAALKRGTLVLANIFRVFVIQVVLGRMIQELLETPRRLETIEAEEGPFQEGFEWGLRRPKGTLLPGAQIVGPGKNEEAKGFKTWSESQAIGERASSQMISRVDAFLEEKES